MGIFNWISNNKNRIEVKLNMADDDKIMLVEQQNRLAEWATRTEMDPEWRKEIINRISKMEKALSGQELDNFTKELAELKLGIGITENEARIVVELSQKIQKAKEKMDAGGNRMDYDKARADMEKYIRTNVEETKNKFNKYN